MNEFFFAAFENSKGDLDFLREEKDEISNTLDLLRERGSTQVEIGLDIGVDSLRKQLLRFSHKITFFHLGSHHDSDYFPVVEGAVPDQALEDILNNCPRLKLVFLNGCSTDEILKELKNVPIVIGAKTKIRDKFAKEVASEFYRLLIKDAANLTDPKSIQECFEKAVASGTIDASKETRSGGDPQDLASSAPENYILYDNRDEVPDYDFRVTYNHNASKYPVNSGLEKVVTNRSRLMGKEQIYINYIRQYPFLFTYHLLKFNPSDNNLSELNLDRYKAIRDLFSDFLIFIKYCGISIYWKQISDSGTRQEDDFNPLIWDHVQYSWKSNNKWSRSLKFCVNLYDRIDGTDGNKGFTNNTMSLLKNTEEELNTFIECFEGVANNDEYHRFCTAEEFLYFFINKCSYLCNYKLISVYNSEYFRFRTTNQQYEYILREYNDRKKPYHPELKISRNCDFEVHAIYLIDKDYQKSGHPTKINLTPFYIDFNTHLEKSHCIKLSYLDQYYKEDEDAEYRFIDEDLGIAQNIKFDDIEDVENFRVQTHKHRIKFHIEELRQIFEGADVRF